METGFITAFWFLAIAALTVPAMLLVGKLIRPRQRNRGSHAIPYECGETPTGSAWIQFNMRFYVVAIIFIIFDVEIAAIFPCTVVFKSAVLTGRGGLAFAELFLFVGLLPVGLVYCWARGDLEWLRGIAQKPVRAARDT